MIVFGVTPAKKTKPDGATDGEDKEKKKSKEKKVKKDVPCLKLSDALDQAPNGARALAAIVTKMVPGVSFNSVKLIWGPGAGMSHIARRPPARDRLRPLFLSRAPPHLPAPPAPRTLPASFGLTCVELVERAAPLSRTP